MAVDLSPYFIPGCPDCISLESEISSIILFAFVGFVLGVIVFIANHIRGLQS